MEKSVVMSLAGHDKGQIYVAVGEKDEKLLLCDGKCKTLENPKPKNKKHLKEIAKVNLSAYNPLYDAHIRSVLKSVKKDNCL